ncbi:MAG: hypothetical protein IKY61_08740 [Thermoguttaceae bacterium]|nr:hypothetical protein [Thermoguttaceae bacterium]
MRNGTKKAAAVAGLAVLGAALWGLGDRQGAQNGQSDLTAETAQVAEKNAGFDGRARFADRGK